MSRILAKKSCGCTADLDLAGNVQQLLLPKGSPVCGWFCMGVKNRMATEIGGDYFDFIEMPDGCQSIFVGDITGHGPHASIVMALLYGYIHRLSEEECNPRKTVYRINRFLQSFARRSDEYDHYFSSTLFYSVISPETLSMHYVNAGHVAPLVRRGDSIVQLGSTTAPVGFFENPEIEVASYQFEKGDRMLLYTDGLLELQSPGGEFFGQARLETFLKDDQNDHLCFLNNLFSELDNFGTDAPRTDDCTAIVIDFHPLTGDS